MQELDVMFNDAMFLTTHAPLVWYKRNARRARLSNVTYVVFQIEHCEATNVLCLRGFAQSAFLKTTAKWREDLGLDEGARICAAPGSSTLMAKQCMTAGVDAQHHAWTVAWPHVEFGVIKIRKTEQMCLDIIRGVPDSEIAARYPRQWNLCRRSIRSFKRILENCPQDDDFEIASRWGMIPIVRDVCAQRKFFIERPPASYASELLPEQPSGPPPAKARILADQPPPEFDPSSFLAD